MYSRYFLIAFIAWIVGFIWLSPQHAYAKPSADEASDALAEGAKLFKSGKFSESITCFDKAIARTFEVRAEAEQLGSGGARRSIVDCNKAIALDPKSAKAFDLRGTNYLILKDYEKALHDYDAAVQLDPQNADRYIARGNAYADLKQFSMSLKDYNHALELQPDSNVYINRARAFDDLGQYDKALKDSNKAIELTAHSKMQPACAALDAINYTNRGRAYLGLGQADKAVTDLSKAISSNPRTLPGEAFYFRAQAYEKLGKSDMAAKDKAVANKYSYKPRTINPPLK